MKKTFLNENPSSVLPPAKTPHLKDIETEHRSSIQRAFQPKMPHERDEDLKLRQDAQEAFIKRYQAPIQAYNYWITRSNTAQTQELWDRFVDKVCGGKLRNYHPSRPLRPFLFQVLKNEWRNLIKKDRKETQWNEENPEHLDAIAFQAEKAFKTTERKKILESVLEAIRTKDDLYSYAIRFREQCNESEANALTMEDNTQEESKKKTALSTALAKYLSEQLQSKATKKATIISEEHARKILERAKRKFASLVIYTVKNSNGFTDLGQVEEELVELNLYKSEVKKELKRMRRD